MTMSTIYLINGLIRLIKYKEFSRFKCRIHRIQVSVWEVENGSPSVAMG